MRYAITGRLAGMAVALGLAGPALAASGDVHEVLPERANLRAGPSEQENIRTTLTEGEEVIEIRREDDWVGIRSLRTGAEGWIHGDLLQTVSPSGLGGAGLADGAGQGVDAGADMGFRQYSRGFDAILANVSRHLGIGPLFDNVAQREDGVLELTPTAAFLRDGGRDAHMLAALAVHQMLKNHQGGQPVAVAMLGPDGADYIDVDDRGGAAGLAVQAAGDAAQQASR